LLPAGIYVKGSTPPAGRGAPILECSGARLSLTERRLLRASGGNSLADPPPSASRLSAAG